MDQISWSHGQNRFSRADSLPHIWDCIYGFAAPGPRRIFNEAPVVDTEQASFDEEEIRRERLVAKDVWSHTPSRSVITGDRMLPEALIRKMILLTTQECDTVFDPFIATGNTYVVAEQLNRKCIGSEVDCDSVRVALERVALLRGFS